MNLGVLFCCAYVARRIWEQVGLPVSGGWQPGPVRLRRWSGDGWSHWGGALSLERISRFAANASDGQTWDTASGGAAKLTTRKPQMLRFLHPVISSGVTRRNDTTYKNRYSFDESRNLPDR